MILFSGLGMKSETFAIFRAMVLKIQIWILGMRAFSIMLMGVRKVLMNEERRVAERLIDINVRSFLNIRMSYMMGQHIVAKKLENVEL